MGAPVLRWKVAKFRTETCPSVLSTLHKAVAATTNPSSSSVPSSGLLHFASPRAPPAQGRSRPRLAHGNLQFPCTQAHVRVKIAPPASACRPRGGASTGLSCLISTSSRQLALAVPSNSAQPPPPDLQPYKPPTTGLLSYLPTSWVPFAELARIDKPAGAYYLFFPCLFSTLLAGCHTGVSPSTVLSTSLLFAAGTVVMRGAGCTINDLWDRNLDPHVARTRLRPLARRAVSPLSAVTFAGAQCLVGLGILLQFPTQCLFWGIPSLLLVATYPLAKRVTHYPQFVLGLTFSWGAIMGFPALGVDVLADRAAQAATGLLYSSCVSWTVLYDMIYAHMDIKDDKTAGIKSIALKHENETKQVLAGLAVVQIGLLAGSGAAIGAGPMFFICSCGGAALTLGTMIKLVNLKQVADCWWWFKYGSWFTGGVISLGLFAEYIERISQPSTENKGDEGCTRD